MIGQKRALIPAVIGIALLLTGITGYLVTSGEQQAVIIAETSAVTPSELHKQVLGSAFRADADEAARQTAVTVTADLRGELQRKSEILAAQWPRRKREQG